MHCLSVNFIIYFKRHFKVVAQHIPTGEGSTAPTTEEDVNKTPQNEDTTKIRKLVTTTDHKSVATPTGIEDAGSAMTFDGTTKYKTGINYKTYPASVLLLFRFARVVLITNEIKKQEYRSAGRSTTYIESF